MQIKNDDNETILLNDYAEKAYLEYAMSVVKGRALPSVGDGQKPVQRRILYSMNQMGLQNNARPVKSAKIVGDILSNYHPHGDSTVYEAMVRMSQNFNLRYPLVEGIGNFGSRDGDSAAAMRYTEARLMPISKLLLSEIHEECVDFIDNFDGSKTEPTILPSRLPFVLLNGASGIAVGMATEIPSHNLKEIGLTAIELIKNKNLSIEDMLNIIKGPDFATGGHIINSKEEILNIYKNGKGSIKVRSKYSTEMLTNNNWRIIINEIPPNTSTKKILSQIEELTNPKPKQGKKNISSEVLKNKNLILSILEKIRDESDEKEPIRIVLEPKSKKINITDFINTLFFLTDLETNVQINFVMVGIDSKPKQKNIKNILDEWLEFRKKTITKRISSQIKKINKRIHILEGRIKIFIHIDSIINIIKDSENPKKNIIQKFKLSEEQAEDILEIKLRQLAKLEFIKLETEIKKLTEELTYFNHILENEISRNKLIINEIKSDINKFSDDRRTIIKETKKATIVQNNDDIPLSIILSKQGWIRSKIGHNLDLSKISFKKTDCLNQIIESTSNSSIILLDSNGKCYTINNSDIPNSKIDGAPISSLVNLQSSSQIISIMYGSLNKKFLFSCDNGYGFIVKLSDLISKTKLGKVIIKIPISNKALPALEIKNYEYNNVLIISDEPKIIAFPISQIKYLSKGKGFKLMQLKEKSKIKFIKIINDDKYTLITKNQQNKINKEQLRIIDILNKKGSKGKPVLINEKIIDIE